MPYPARLSPPIALAVALTAVLAMLVGPMAYAAPTLRVAVDGSGSMRGYFETRALDQLLSKIGAAAQKAGWAPDTKVFHTRADADAPVEWTDLTAWRAPAAKPPWGQVTRLDVAVRQAVRGASATVLITDNFQETGGGGGGGAGQTERFYATLGALPLSRVLLAPALLAFDGNIDLALGDPADRPNAAAELKGRLEQATAARFRGARGIGEPSWVPQGRFWKVPYTGQRGLAVYLLLSSAKVERAAQFRRFVDALEATTALSPLLLRPLGGDALTVRAASQDAPDPAGLRCAGLSAEALPPVNAKLLDGQLVPDTGGYDPRQPLRLTAAVEVVSTTAHIRLADQSATCASAARLSIDPVMIVAAPHDLGLLLQGAEGGGGVYPPSLMAPLASDSNAPRAARLTLDLPALVGANAPDARVFDGHMIARTALVAEVPRDSLRLSKTISRRYFTRDPLDLARIYSPRDLVTVFGSAPARIRLPIEVRSTRAQAAQGPHAEVELWSISQTVILVFSVLVAAFFTLSPFGFTVPVLVRPGHHAQPVRVGGFLRRRAARVNVGGDVFVELRRAGPVRRTLAVLDADDGALGELRPGATLSVGERTITWLTRATVRRLKEEGRYDAHDAG